jgi:hypothetical protein
MPLSLNALDVHDSRNPVYSSTVCLDCFIEILSLRRSGDIGQTFGVKVGSPWPWRVISHHPEQ